MEKLKIVIVIILITFLIFFAIGRYYNSLQGQSGLTILYTTDIQGRLDAFEDFYIESIPKPIIGGIAYFASYVEKERKAAKKKKWPIIFLDTGNLFSGSLESNLSNGKLLIDVMNNLKLDALAIGNKDYVFGEDNLRELSKKATFPFLSANIIKEGGESVDYLKPYIIKDYPKFKVGIIGMTRPLEYEFLLKDVRGLKFIEPEAALSKYIPIIKKEKANLIIVLSNLGLEEDIKLAKKFKDIDVLIGGNDEEGHRSSFLFSYIINKAIIPDTYHKAAMGYSLDLMMDKHKKIKRYQMRESDLYINRLKPDLKTQAIIKKYKNDIINMKEKIGYAETTLTISKDEESTLGSWIGDAIRQITKADIVLIAGLQTDLKQGEITIADIYNILPVINKLGIVGFNLAIFELTGEQIKELLEAGVSYGLEDGKGVLQVSGLKYSYDLKRKKWDRIVDVNIDGEKLNLSKTYKVAANGYLASGVGGYYIVKDTKRRYDTGLMDFDVLVEYIKEHSPITAPPLVKRIVRIE